MPPVPVSVLALVLRDDVDAEDAVPVAVWSAASSSAPICVLSGGAGAGVSASAGAGAAFPASANHNSNVSAPHCGLMRQCRAH